MDIRTTVRNAPPFPWEQIKDAVLGKRYELSLIICGDSFAQKVNKESRRKSYVPNVLSFPLTQHEGEIVLNIKKAYAESADYEHGPLEHTLYLYLHGLLHLKGMDHGDTMELAEKRMLRKFSDLYTHETHHHRN